MELELGDVLSERPYSRTTNIFLHWPEIFSILVGMEWGGLKSLCKTA